MEWNEIGTKFWIGTNSTAKRKPQKSSVLIIPFTKKKSSTSQLYVSVIRTTQRNLQEKHDNHSFHQKKSSTPQLWVDFKLFNIGVPLDEKLAWKK